MRHAFFKSSNYVRPFIGLLAFILFATQTVAVSHIHYHPQSTEKSDIVASSFTPELTKFVLTYIDAGQGTTTPESPAEHDDNCVLCLLFQLSWFTATTLIAFKPLQLSDNPFAALPQVYLPAYGSSSLARAPPQFS